MEKLKAKIIEKPWGREEWIIVNDKYALKKLFIKKGHRFSLQYHEKKMETWQMLEGRLLATMGRNGDHKDRDLKQIEFLPGEIIHVPANTVHRLEALEDSLFIEVSTPELDDVVRIEDDYNRE